MFSKASHLILANCAAVSTLITVSTLVVLTLALSTASSAQQSRTGQGPYTVSIQPSAANRPGRPVVVVTVDKSRVRVGETVRFTLSPAALVTNPKLNVTVDFGDGTRIETRQTEVTHTYSATGHYKVYASVVSPGFEFGSPDDETPRRVPPVTLIANPTSVTAGSRVYFNARLASNYPNIKYRFVFGDGSQTDWQETPFTSHSYTPGTYLAYVDLGVGDAGRIKQVGGSVRQSILVVNSTRPSTVTDRKTPDDSKPQPDDRKTQPDDPKRPKPEILPGPVQLTANPTPVEIDKPVNFNARADSTNPGLRYRFVYGDGKSTSWQNSSQTTHAYAAPGNYSASVSMGLATKGTIRSLSNARLGIQVTKSSTPVVASASPKPSPPVGPTPRPGATTTPGVTTVGPISDGGNDVVNPVPLDEVPNNWWVFLLIALLLIFVGYQVYRFVFAPKTTFHANRDIGNSEMDTTTDLSINSQVLLRPNIADGQYLVESSEPNLIRSVRRKNV